MEVPTPPQQHPAVRSGRGDSYVRDKGAVTRWATGVVATAALAGIGWTGTHILAAERVNEVQDSRIKGVEERTAEDRALIRDELREHSQKLDRVLERMNK